MAKITSSLIVILGCAMIGSIVYPAYFVDRGAQTRQETLVQEYQNEVSSGVVEHKNTQAVLRIPAFGDDYAMPIVNGMVPEVLNTGVVARRKNGTQAGDLGNYALAGHRITRGEPFRDLPGMEIGDIILVDDDGWTYTYEVFRVHEVDHSNVWVVDNYDKTRRLITLVTCASLFETDNRTVVVGELVGSRLTT